MAALLVLLAVGGAGFWYLTAEDSPGEDTSSAASPSPEDVAAEVDSALQEALDASEEAGAAAVKTRLDAKMPKSLDDGLPERRIKGEGVVAADRAAATMDYKMSKIPNSAGFFGHVDGELAVAYSGAEMMISFPLLEGVLAKEPEPGTWLSWDLEFLSTEYLLDLGVGQLRELALSDPRLGLALLTGVEEAEEPTEGEVGGTPVSQYEVQAGTLEAGDAVPELEPIFTEMWEGLAMRRIPMTVSVDEEGRIRRLEYRLVYPEKRAPILKGTRNVRLDVRHNFTEFGVEDEPELPPEDEVVTHEEYFLED